MVKCPRGTPFQIKANFQHFNQSTTFSFPSTFFSWIYDSEKDCMVHVGERESEILGSQSEDLDLDSVRADKRCPPSARDELVFFFINYFLDILIKSWDSKPCKKPNLMHAFTSADGEYFGEDLGPCDGSINSSMAELLKDLSQKRLNNLSKDNLKKDSESTESEYLNEDDLEIPVCIDPVHETLPDEEVHFELYNGVWYKGRVSRKLMDGDGTYFWEDGSSYQGEFVGGCVTGKGRLEFSNMTVYEGDVYKAFRHGEGMCCFFNSPVMYSGQWWLGKKHGYGLIVYSDPFEVQNFYRGQWQDGYKEGFGFRQYPSGAKYIGFWSNGKRHGKGVMIWKNYDIYRGQWKEGLMHGYGEYTWNGFVNKTLSYPASNTYRGCWSEGSRNGIGVLECKNGALIETFWVNNIKNGAGTVICCNGTVVASKNLFEKDKQAPFSDQEDNLGLLIVDSANPKRPSNKNRNKEHIMAYLASVERAKAISIPILSPPHTLNVELHTRKYYIQRKLELKKKEPNRDSNFDILKFEMETDEVPRESLVATGENSLDSKNVEHSKKDLSEPCQLIESVTQEDRQLRNFIIAKTSELKACYDHYATLACEKPPSYQCILLRMFLWQMFIDAAIPSSELSVVDIDIIIAQEESLLIVSPHDPFERIYFWQFLHILILLSWHLYGQYVIGEEPLIENERIKNFLKFLEASQSNVILKTAFEFFLIYDIFRGRFGPDYDSFSYRETRFEDSDLAPMEAIFNIYCCVGIPHSARDFLNAVCCKEDEGDFTPGIVRYFEKLPFYKMDGRNALMVAGELHYFPGPEPFNYPQLFPLEDYATQTASKCKLTCFNDLKAADVLKCLIEVCPAIVSDGMVVNMDYKLTFLEFYKVIILCTERQLKLKVMKEIRADLIRDYKIQLEECEKKLENEKHNDAGSLILKKSRQTVEGQKKKN